MTKHELQLDLVRRACAGNAEAVDFVLRWGLWIHAIDDVMDTSPGPETTVGAFVQSMELFTSPFFLKSGVALKPLVYQAANFYADSEVMKTSTVDWQRQFAEFARHAGAEMLLAVAQLTGGYQHQRNMSAEIRAFHYAELNP